MVSINGKDTKIDLNDNYNQNQKPTVKCTWRDTEMFTVDTQAFYSKTQEKVKKIRFCS